MPPPGNYSLKYRTFNQLFEDVSIDFRNYSLEGLIEPQTLLKVARRCNYELGFRIYRTRQAILEVENGQVRMPDDFHILNYATVCGEHTITEALPQGTHLEERLIAPTYVPDPGQPSTCCPSKPCVQPTCGSCTPNSCDSAQPCDTIDPCTGVNITKCGDEYQLIQKIHTTNRTYKEMYPLHIEENERIQCDCPNTQWKGARNKARIENGFLKVNFDQGKVYINYMGDMIDNDGNIMVPDHELLNEFYEYALKERILENLIWNDENVGSKYEIALMKLRAARNNAMSLVNTPNFAEMKKLWQVNRKAQYHNYYNMFRSHWPLSYDNYGYQR